MAIPKHLLEAKICNMDTCELKKTIVQMKERINDLLKENTEWKLENERLNNIINELEKHIEKEAKDYFSIDEYVDGTIQTYQEILDKLKELKEQNDWK